MNHQTKRKTIIGDGNVCFGIIVFINILLKEFIDFI